MGCFGLNWKHYLLIGGFGGVFWGCFELNWKHYLLIGRFGGCFGSFGGGFWAKKPCWRGVFWGFWGCFWHTHDFADILSNVSENLLPIDGCLGTELDPTNPRNYLL